MKATLADWHKNGWLKEHKPSREEIADLFAVADRDLAASQTPGLTNDWRFNIAYNAALQLATAALAAAGGGPTRSEEHTSELQSHLNLVCRLLLQKKNDYSPLASRHTHHPR